VIALDEGREGAFVARAGGGHELGVGSVVHHRLVRSGAPRVTRLS
jgi:hypothetical protein